jgi:hypothetical protein
MLFFRAPLVCLCVAVFVPAAAYAQETASPPVSSVAVVVDNSAMPKAQWQQLRDNVNAFLSAFNGENDEVALFTAGGGPQRQEDLTSDVRRISNRLQQLTPSEDSVALYQTLDAAIDYLGSEASHQHTGVVAFVATGDRGGDAEAQKLVRGNGRPGLYFIGLPGSDWRTQQTLQQLSAATKGRSYFPSDPDQLREVSSVLGRQLASGDIQLTPDPRLNDRKPLTGYQRVLVHSINARKSKNVDDPQGNDALVRTLLISELKREHVFRDVIDASREQPFTTPADETDTLTLLPRLLEYRKGSRLQRQFIGWKGEARYVLQVSLFNAATRQPVAAFVEKGTSASGVFGGSDEVVHAKAMHSVVNKIIDDLKHAK